MLQIESAVDVCCCLLYQLFFLSLVLNIYLSKSCTNSYLVSHQGTCPNFGDTLTRQSSSFSGVPDLCFILLVIFLCIYDISTGG